MIVHQQKSQRIIRFVTAGCFTLLFSGAFAQEPIRWMDLAPKKSVYTEFQSVDDTRFIGKAPKDGMFIHTASNQSVTTDKSAIGYYKLFYGFDILHIGTEFYELDQVKDGDKFVFRLETIDPKTFARTETVKTLLTEDIIDNEKPWLNDYTVAVTENHLFLRRYNKSKLKIAVFNSRTLELLYSNEFALKIDEMSFYPSTFSFTEKGDIDLFCANAADYVTTLVEAIITPDGITFGKPIELEDCAPESMSFINNGTKEILHVLAAERGHGGIPVKLIALETNFPAITLLSTEELAPENILKDFDPELETAFYTSYEADKMASREFAPQFFTSKSHCLGDGGVVTIFQGTSYVNGGGYSEGVGGYSDNNFYIVKSGAGGKIEWTQFIRSEFYVGYIEKHFGGSYSFIDPDGQINILFNEMKQYYDESGAYISRHGVKKQLYMGDNLSKLVGVPLIAIESDNGEYTRKLAAVPAEDFIIMPGKAMKASGKTIIYGSNAKQEAFGEIREMESSCKELKTFTLER